MRFADIRGRRIDPGEIPAHLLAATTPAKPKSTRPNERPQWFGARIQAQRDLMNQKPLRSRRRRTSRKPRVGRWK